ncbi:MAG TPA: efflux RND transporter permease subunit [Candidatus Cryptobacteroides merdipullorum]|uniref:Efflux RND transporter permease subunit n=1 Tax=Candidatus Cryptobacteroides merdipullorum TaxID=2840771 RepID=A0A9D1GPP9_9BACT|nr:efflux RND transporter permease subunit [Candidatus Cryptobacteroides merdipullorum]
MDNRKSPLILWTIRHKSIIYLILVVLVGIGIYGISKMNKDEYPSFEIKQGLVAAVYPGASSLQVEEQVAKPVEQVLLSFDEVNSQNLQITSKDGICYMLVDLVSPARTKDEVWSKIKMKLNETKSTLPPGVLALVVIDDFASVSSSLIAMESEDKSYSELKALADELCDRLRQIPELAAVTVYGSLDEEIAVTVDMEKLSGYGISPSSLMLGYQSSTLQVPSGSFNTSYASSPIHIESPVSSEREIAERIVWSDPSGGIVRLKDIAKVERRYKDPSSFVNYNGNSCLIISVEMRPDNDIVAFGKKLDKVIDEYEQELPDSVTMTRITDQPKLVRNSVFSFLRDLVISMIVVIIVMLMLFPVRSALIASSGVPVCTAVALAVMFLTGIGLNTVTLAGLIVVLGMIVDDSIITMDGYMGELGKGMSREDAAQSSARELVTPMVTATTALSLMFFPCLGIITGYLGDFVTYFPWVVAIALTASLLYAIFVVPSLEVRFIKSASVEQKSLFSRIQNKFFTALQGAYDSAQDWCFHHPRLTLGAGVGAVVLAVVLFLQLNIQMMPMADRDFFAVEVSLDSNAGLEDTKAVVDSLQNMFLKDSRIESVTSFIGSSAPRFTATYTPATPAPNYAQLIVNTRSIEATKSLLPEYEEKYEHYFPEALIRIKQMDYQAATPIEIRVQGADLDVIKPVADTIKSHMQGRRDELKWVHSTVDDYLSCVEVKLDADEAARLGVNKAMLSLSVAGTFSGMPLASLWEGDKSIPVNLYSSGVTDGMSYDMIGNQQVSTSMPGVSVPLRQVADIQPGWEPAQRTRYASEETIIISADMKNGQSQPASMKEIRKFVDGLDLPEGVHVSYGGLTEINNGVIPQIGLAFLCAVAVMFILLLIHFRKISIAVLTIVLSALCLFGAFLGLWVFGLDFSITAALGLISLVGIIVRNGIILFEYAEELRFRGGLSIKEAAAMAGKRRMRPIFLTSCTTALGVLPMILSGDQLWLPMGVVICFGTLLSVVMITLIMPVSYWQIFRKDKRPKEVTE